MASYAHISQRWSVVPENRSICSFWLDPRTISTVAAGGILLHLIVRYILHASVPAWQSPLIAIIVYGGLPLLISLTRKLLAFEFGSDHLAGVSIITSVILGEYLVGVIVILMLSGGTALEEFATRRASSVLDALARRMPQIAHRRTGYNIADVKLTDIAIGDTVVTFPHETCPVDG